jgi:hypothetical protein
MEIESLNNKNEVLNKELKNKERMVKIIKY